MRSLLSYKTAGLLLNTSLVSLAKKALYPLGKVSFASERLQYWMRWFQKKCSFQHVAALRYQKSQIYNAESYKHRQTKLAGETANLLNEV